MSEIDQARRAIARCEAKQAAADDVLSRYYFRMCAEGWRRWLAKLLAGEG